MVKIEQVVTKSQRGPVLKLIFSLADVSSRFESATDSQVSETFNINNTAEVRFQFTSKHLSPSITYCVAYKKHESAAEHTVKMNVTCEKTQYSKQFVCPENFTGWVEVGEITKQSPCRYVVDNHTSVNCGLNVLEITLSAYKVETITFPKLYEDEEFCDFNLMTEDGTASVPVHKACLAAHSDMFRIMLRGEWKETINGCIKIQGVTSQTLKHLKEYFYLGTLPEDGAQLQLLLALSKCYMVDNLKTECIMKLALTVQPEDLFSLQDFAVANQIPELSRAILLVTPDRTVQGANVIENEKDGGPSQAKKKRSDSENVLHS